jgi:MFS family permease
MLPLTVIMLLLSSRAGGLAQRIGPRLPVSLGAFTCAGGVLLMLRIGPAADYLTHVLPAVTVLGLGVALLVAPLTATALSSVSSQHAGIASGVNNAVARAAALIAVAVLPAVGGLAGDSYTDPQEFERGFDMAVLVAATLLIAAGLIAAFTISNRGLDMDAATPPTAVTAVPESSTVRFDRPTPLTHCAVDGPPPLVAIREQR